MKQLKKKRIKRVFSSSSEVFHLWASQSQDYARQGGSRTRCFYEDKQCYSYGHHYEVGRLVKINGRDVALINRSGYSHTTSKHINEAASAVSHMYTISVDDSFNWKQGLLTMQSGLIDDLFDNLKRRSFWSGVKAFDGYDRKRFDRFNKLCAAVGMPQLCLYPNDETISLIQEHINRQCKRKALYSTLRETPEYKAKLEAQRAKLEALEVKKQQDQIEAWKKGGAYTNAVTQLRPQIIRVKDGQVQTNTHASVDLVEAKLALNGVLNKTIKKGDKIGIYQYTKHEGDTVIIGCHHISLEQAKTVLLNKGEE